MRRGGVQYYYAQDAEGNVRGLINTAGAVVASYDYSPQGELVGSTGSVTNPYRYKGREWDAEAGLYFMRARYYDPKVARFVSEDPIGVAGGMSLYAFGGGDPVNFSDPSGLTPRCLVRRRDSGGNLIPGCELWSLDEVQADAGDDWPSGFSPNFGRRPSPSFALSRGSGGGGGFGETLRAFISRPGCQNALLAAAWSVAGDATLAVAGFRSAVKVGTLAFTYRRALGKSIGFLPAAAAVGRGGMRRGLHEIGRGVNGAAGVIVGGLHESIGANWAAEAVLTQLPTDSLWELVPIVGSAIALRDAYNICGGS